MKLKQVVLGALAALLLAGFAAQSAAPVFAGGEPSPRVKCNSGKGNGFETDPATDCDPGNSSSHNNGGG